MRISAAHALFLLGDKSGVPVARKYLKDKNAGLRKMSVDVLGVMGVEQDYIALKAMASDPDPQVQQALKIALTRLAQNYPDRPAAKPQAKSPAPAKKKAQ